MGGRGRRRILLGLTVAMLFGIAVYLRLWTIDYTISSDEAELLRRQFDLANKEAMDESAEWRLRYDKEFERAFNCAKELEQVKESTKKKMEDTTSFNQKVAMLQKENAALLKQVEVLKEELEAVKSSCHL